MEKSAQTSARSGIVSKVQKRRTRKALFHRGEGSKKGTEFRAPERGNSVGAAATNSKNTPIGETQRSPCSKEPSGTVAIAGAFEKTGTAGLFAKNLPSTAEAYRRHGGQKSEKGRLGTKGRETQDHVRQKPGRCRQDRRAHARRINTEQRNCKRPGGIWSAPTENLLIKRKGDGGVTEGRKRKPGIRLASGLKKNSPRREKDGKKVIGRLYVKEMSLWREKGELAEVRIEVRQEEGKCGLSPDPASKKLQKKWGGKKRKTMARAPTSN